MSSVNIAVCRTGSVGAPMSEHVLSTDTAVDVWCILHVFLGITYGREKV